MQTPMRETFASLMLTIIDALKANASEYSINNKPEFRPDGYLTHGRKLTMKFADGQEIVFEHTLAVPERLSAPEAEAKPPTPPEDLPRQPSTPHHG